MNEITRDAAIARIREQLIAIREEGKSMCAIAGERNILCGGFRGDSDAELQFRYAAVLPDATHLSREELETRANEWQVERTKREPALLCCDVQFRYYETCRGWDDFSNEQLAEYCLELTGERVRVTGRKTLAVL